MNGRTIYATVIVVTIAMASIVVYAQNPTDFPNRNASASVILHSGTVITINSSDHVMQGGALGNYTFYEIEYNLSLSSYRILSGSWKSTGLSLVWIEGDNELILEYPIPHETHGFLNQTLLPSTYGNYTLVVAGYPGDKISIMSSIELTNYTPSQVGTFSIPVGTEINSPEIYSFYLDRPGVMVGSFYTGRGAYSYSFLNSPSNNAWGSTFVSDYNSSAMPALTKFSLSQDLLVFGPGNCSIYFGGGTFYVNQTISFLFFYDNSS